MKKGLLVLGTMALVTVSSYAETVFGEGTKDISINTAPVLTMAGIVVGAIAGIWAVKKVIGLGNKS